MRRTLGAGLLLFLLNWYICGKLATIEYLRAMHSIEGAYIGISRYVIENWRDLTWFPAWYAGIPYQNSYPPLLHVVVAGLASLSGLSPAASYHIVEAALYSLGPVALCWLAARWSGSLGCGVFAGVFYSLVSPSAFLITNVREDLGGLFNMRRLNTIVFYGDAPYVSALALVPIALACLDLALRRRRPLTYLVAAVAMAAVVLTNWLGAAALALGVLAYLLGHGEPRRAWPASLAIAILAYALASPWVPPSTLKTIRFNSQTVGGEYRFAWHQAGYAALLAVVVVVVVLLLRKLRAPAHLRAALLFLLLTGGITLSAEWAGVLLVPQPSRYHQAMEIAIALAVAFSAWPLWRRMPAWGKGTAVVLVLGLSLGQAYRLRRWADPQIQPIDIRATTEYKTAQWFDRNMAGRRVMAPGSTSLFLNAFTDTPQLAGGFDQGVVNWYARVAVYIIYSGLNAGDRDAEISLLWLKAFGVDGVAVGGPASGEHYKPFVNPRKFEGVIPELWRDGDDRIYRVPRRSLSLAHVVRRGDLVSRPPIHGLDVDEIRRYVAALDDPVLPIAAMEWTSRHSARIRADLEKDQLLSVQVTYHPGWRAEVNGVKRPVQSDKIGLMVVEPQCEGPCEVNLIYDGGTEMRVARTVSLASLAGLLAWALFSRRRRRGVRV
jgi:hypothetical protein